VGFCKVKAARVIDLAGIIVNKYGGTVPESREELMTIPGVGRKTANVVLSDSMGIPAIAVDTHVQRISKRIGWSKSDDPEKTEEVLMKIVPHEDWVGFNPVMVEFGKTVCKPIGPKCNQCLINSFCDFYAKNKK
jgi:endonuclease-3